MCNCTASAFHQKINAMQRYTQPLLAAGIIAVSFLLLTAGTRFQKSKRQNPSADTVTKGPDATTPVQEMNPTGEQKIQVAILLDVSNSMDGLIDQAKAQLWTMVNTLGRVQCDNKKAPRIEIALYEYGTPRNDAESGYIKQINNFITDLDSLSENLFALTTNGGDEYCGQVIYRSMQELKWDPNPASYKVIFIAGNESFRQGTVSFTKACEAAKNKGVVVNTVYCGDRMQGIREYWNLQAECGNGTFSFINQNEKIEDIPTPFDELIYKLNQQLNQTYIPYGVQGKQYYSKQEQMDVANATVSKKAAIQRAEAKSNSKIYNNSGWDLVDRASEGDAVYDQVDFKTLPDSLQRKSKAQLKQVVEQKRKERASIQAQIISANQKRAAYIREQQAKGTTGKQPATLETEVEKIIRDQVLRYRMQIQ